MSASVGRSNVDEECPVCFTSWDECSDSLQTPCKHTFCGRCIRRLLQDRNTCPLCRNPIDIEHCYPPGLLDGFKEKFDVEEGQLNEQFNYNYGPKPSKRQLITKGKRIFHPPYEWYKIAYNCLNLDVDMNWLSAPDMDNQWPIAYHGTLNRYVSSIFHEGLRVRTGDEVVHGQACGQGIYCAPRIQDACKYSTPTKIAGKKYNVVFLVRVRPGSYTMWDCMNMQMWVITNKEDVRITGVLLKPA